ncbi:hypothetical protein LJR129_001486 [Acidovorax sp. LjRoot129]|uniref:hypothetical protein n=1 Tax=Acidovorax sp. LjRoot129 TaxID=3342260 RepID=UPI0012144CC9|nr:MAG: hypothetical protein EON50_01095 [Acidovorax sp.]
MSGGGGWGGGWVRPVHRWVSVVFTVTVTANFVAMAVSAGGPPPWITYAPLAPLAVLWLTGVYLFVRAMLQRKSTPRAVGGHKVPVA